MLPIVIGSTIKGVVAGVVMGFVARKFRSLPMGIVVGLIVGALLSFLVAHMQRDYYFEIMPPGSIVGALSALPHSNTGSPGYRRDERRIMRMSRQLK